MATKIKPTVGRVVLYVPGPGDHANEGQPHAATVAFVHDDNLVNLSIVDANGMQYSRTHIPLVQDVQDGAPLPAPHGYCHWMPYQVGQAAKTEELETKLSGGAVGGIGAGPDSAHEATDATPDSATEPMTESEQAA